MSGEEGRQGNTPQLGRQPGQGWLALAASLDVGIFLAYLVGAMFLRPRAALQELIAWRGITPD